MAPEICSVALTMIGGRALGRISRKIRSKCDMPSAARRVDELALSQRQELRAHQARGGRPGQDPDDEDDVPDAGAEQRHDHDGQEELRQDLEHLGDAHQELIDGAAEIARERARPCTPDESRCGRPRQRPTMSDVRAPADDVAEDVAAEAVGAQEMRGGRRLEGSAQVEQAIGRQDRREIATIATIATTTSPISSPCPRARARPDTGGRRRARATPRQVGRAWLRLLSSGCAGRGPT